MELGPLPFYRWKVTITRVTTNFTKDCPKIFPMLSNGEMP